MKRPSFWRKYAILIEAQSRCCYLCDHQIEGRENLLFYPNTKPVVGNIVLLCRRSINYWKSKQRPPAWARDRFTPDWTARADRLLHDRGSLQPEREIEAGGAQAVT